MKEITGPVVAMTLTLAAVLAPLGFTGGLTGALFREFAFTLAGAVIISGVVALTITPTMAARLLKSGEASRFQRIVDRTLRPGGELVRAAGVELARLPPGDDPDGAGAARRHRLHVHQDHHRARAGGGPGRALRHPERPALRDARLHPALHRPDLSSSPPTSPRSPPSSRSSASARQRNSGFYIWVFEDWADRDRVAGASSSRTCRAGSARSPASRASSSRRRRCPAPAAACRSPWSSSRSTTPQRVYEVAEEVQAEGAGHRPLHRGAELARLRRAAGDA